jgi:hypothetical protein
MRGARKRPAAEAAACGRSDHHGRDQSVTAQTPAQRSPQATRAFWLRQLYTWHWISSAMCLVGMVLFAVTGVTLNHAGIIKAEPKITHRTIEAPAAVRQTLARGPVEGETVPLPPPVRQWLGEALSIDVPIQPAEWSEDEVYLAMPRPGGDAWVRFDRLSGAVEYEKTTRGALSLLNDLHKGRNTGVVWRWFIDIFAAACVIFSLTGLLLLQMHSRSRAATWPLVAFGLAAPLILVLLFIHL